MYNKYFVVNSSVLRAIIFLVPYFISAILSSCGSSKEVMKKSDLGLVVSQDKGLVNYDIEDIESIEPTFEDNSLSSAIWEKDREALLKNMDNDQFISHVDSVWMSQMYSAGIFKIKKHSKKVSKISDSIIKLRLKKLDKITPLDLNYNPVVKRYIEAYLYKHSSQMEKMMGLAEYYYPMFEEVLDKYDIPLELKHLAVVESGLNPRAKSPVGATGLWQFMYATGMQYGLNVSSYVDERCDPIKETEAAAKYMKALYRMFGDWNLVLAAYNSGPGNVKKAIRRSGGHRNYWYIRPYLPRETRNYVPAFIAVNYAMTYAKTHGLEPNSIKISYYNTDTIAMKEKITFAQISKKIGISTEELEFLNPSYKLKIMPLHNEKKYMLVLPVPYVDAFVRDENEIYAYVREQNEKNKTKMPKEHSYNNRIRYRVRKGDNLGYIAGKYGVRVSELKRWNRLRNSNIRIGQRLTVYPRKI